jgi:hypothetical protein
LRRGSRRNRTVSKSSIADRIPLPPLPPDFRGRTVHVKSLKVARREAAAVRRKDWIRAAFGDGEAAAFLRRCARDGLSVRKVFMRLRRDAANFRNKRDLEALAAELCRSDAAGTYVSRALTPKLLIRLLTSRKGDRRVR